MRKKHILHFFAGLVGSSLFTCGVYIYLFRKQFDVLDFNYMKKLEAQHQEFALYSFVLLAITVSISVLFYIKKLKPVSVGFIIPAIVSLSIFLVVFAHYLNKENYYQNFDKTVWLKDRPVKMMIKLEHDSLLIKLTKAQIIAMLGKSDLSNYIDTNVLFYSSISNTDCQLEIVLENEKVKSVRMGCD